MLRHRNLILVVIGQALLIGLLLGLKSQRNRRKSEQKDFVTLQADDSTEGESATLKDALSIAHDGLASMQQSLIDYQGRVIQLITLP